MCVQGKGFRLAAGQPDLNGGVVQPGPGGKGPGGGKTIDPAYPPVQAGHRRVVGVEDLEIAGLLAPEQAGLGGDIGVVVGIAVQVVRGEVQERRGLGMEVRGGVQLEAAHLQHQQVRLFLPGQEGDHRGADIAAHQGFFARGVEQLPQQGGGGGLAVGAAHRQERPLDKGRGHFQFAHHREARGPGRREPGKLRRHSRGQDDGIKALPAGLGHAQVLHHPRPPDVPAKVGQVFRPRLVGDRHPGALLGQETAQGHAGSGQADD